MKIGKWSSSKEDLANGGSSTRTKAVISAFIFGIAMVHAAPIVQEMRSPGQTMWPIMAWGMYRTSHRPPVQTTSWEVIAETSEGERKTVRPIDAGQGPNGFMRVYVRPMVEGDSMVARGLGEILNREPGARVLRLVVEGVTYQVTDGGVVSTPEEPITYRLGE